MVTDAEIDAEWDAYQASQQPKFSGLRDRLAGTVASTGQGLFGNFLDEMAGVANTAVAVPKRLFGGEGLSVIGDIPEMYSQYQQQAKQGLEAYQEENPISSTVSEIGGAVLSPANKIKLGKGLFGAISSGAAQGALFGAGAGEGGIVDRLDEVAQGAALGGGTTAAFKAGGKLASKVGDWATESGVKAKLNSLGIKYGDIKKSLNKGIRKRGDQAPIIKAAKNLEKKGVIVPGKASENLKNVEDDLLNYHGELGNLLDSADQLQTDVLKINFPKTQKFIQDQTSLTKEEANGLFDKIYNAAKKERATISDWTKEQVGLNLEGRQSFGLTGSEAMAANLKKWMARDIKESLESELSKPQYKGANIRTRKVLGELSDRYQVLDALGKAAAKEESEVAANKLIGFMRTSGGVGVPAIVGGTVGGAPGALLAAGVAGGALKTEAGRRMTAQALDKGGRQLSTLGSIADSLAVDVGRVASSQVQPDEPTKLGTITPITDEQIDAEWDQYWSNQDQDSSTVAANAESLESENINSQLGRTQSPIGQSIEQGEVLEEGARGIPSPNYTTNPQKKSTDMKKIKKDEGFQYVESALNDAGIDDPLERAQFLGQLGHESMGFTRLEEIGGGKKYEGREDLGNTEPGDGERYKGRGFIQLTGRANYRDFGELIGVDLENNPELASDPEIAAQIAVAYWNNRVKPRVKDFNDTTRITKLINGGTNGLADRKKRFAKFRETFNV